MDEYLKKNSETVKTALRVFSDSRSYDDILLLKAWLMRCEFYTKNLANIANPSQMNDICRYLELEEYRPGDVVFNQGDIGNKVFILFSGSCDLRVRYKIDLTQGQSEIREKMILTYDTIGQYFGERALQYDEPRSGTVLCKETTVLVTVTKASYLAVIKAAKNDPAWKIDANAPAPPSTKETVLEVLSKMRNKRSNQELDSVASYLHGRIQFFQKFTKHQLVELCRVCEAIQVDGRRVLFKEGQSGQAFYVVLSGTVEVWVKNAAKNQHYDNHKKVTAGLGARVNELIAGEAFGERALESEDSMRMASIVTCDGITDLIAIAREDYHNFVFVMQKSDTMKRLALLRKTELFRTVDVMHLKDLARFMRPKHYQVKEVLYKAGQKAVEMIIIESGEGRVETEIREGIDLAEQARRHRIRTAPHYMQPTLALDGTYHEGESGVTPFHEDPYHQKHPELAHRHPTDAAAQHSDAMSTTPRNRFSPLPSPRSKSKKQQERQQHSPVNGNDDSFHVGKGVLRLDSAQLQGMEQESPTSSRLNALASSPNLHPNSPLPTTASAAAAAFKEFATTDSEAEEAAVATAATAAAAATDDAAMRQLGTGSVYNLKLKRKDRLRTVEMVESQVRTVNLGRIAPNTVLATYVTAGSLQDDIFHPESVIADTFVTAYVVAKTDFFNHLSRDAHDALVRIIADFKPPELHSLWQNAPRQLNEAEWKREKTWKVYKKKLLNSAKRNVDILDTYKHLGNVHLSANSGNDDYTSINQKNKRLREARELRKGGTHVVVTSDWGLRPRHNKDTSNNNNSSESNSPGRKTTPGVPAAMQELERLEMVAAAAMQAAEQGQLGAGRYLHLTEEEAAVAVGDEQAAASTRRKSMALAAVGGFGRRPAQLITNSFLSTESEDRDKFPTGYSAKAQAETDLPAQDGLSPTAAAAATSVVDATQIIISAAVSSMLQKRVKDAHFGEYELKKELFAAHSPRPDTGDPNNPLAQFSPRSAFPQQAPPLMLSPSSKLVIPKSGAGKRIAPHGPLLLSDDLGSATELGAVNIGESVYDSMSIFDGRSAACEYQMVQLHKAVGGKPVMKTPPGMPRPPKHRIYARLCGGADSSVGAKGLAEAQMEHIAMSSLFRKEPTRETQLQLQWRQFSGFADLPLSYSDHFIVYHRNTPIHYASINPSKNIFNALFPPLCRPDHHRYGCIALHRVEPVSSSIVLETSFVPPPDDDPFGVSPLPSNPVTRPTTSAYEVGDSACATDATDADATDAAAGEVALGTAAVRFEIESSNNNPNTGDTNNEAAANTTSPEHRELEEHGLISTGVEASEGRNSRSRSSKDAEDIQSVRSVLSNDSRDYKDDGWSESVDGAEEDEEALLVKELGVVYEMLWTSESRIESLRYAIHRFGSLTDPTESSASPSQEAGGNEGAWGSSSSKHQSHVSTGIASVGADATIYLRPQQQQQQEPDILLVALHSEKLCVSIVPLFRWVLINEDTITGMDFTKGFNSDPSAKLLFIQNEADGGAANSSSLLERTLYSRTGSRGSALGVTASLSQLRSQDSITAGITTSQSHASRRGGPSGTLAMSRSLDSLPLGSASLLSHQFSPEQSLGQFIQSRALSQQQQQQQGDGKRRRKKPMAVSLVSGQSESAAGVFKSKYSDAGVSQQRLAENLARMEFIHRTRFQKVTLESVLQTEDGASVANSEGSPGADTASLTNSGRWNPKKSKSAALNVNNRRQNKGLLTASFMSQSSQSGAGNFMGLGAGSGSGKSRHSVGAGRSVSSSGNSIASGSSGGAAAAAVGLSGGAHGGAYVVGAVGRRLEQSLQALSTTFPTAHKWSS